MTIDSTSFAGVATCVADLYFTPLSLHVSTLDNSLSCPRYHTMHRPYRRKIRLVPEEESLAGAEVGLPIAALVLLIPLEPPRRTVRAEHLQFYKDTS